MKRLLLGAALAAILFSGCTTADKEYIREHVVLKESGAPAVPKCPGVI